MFAMLHINKVDDIASICLLVFVCKNAEEKIKRVFIEELSSAINDFNDYPLFTRWAYSKWPISYHFKH